LQVSRAIARRLKLRRTVLSSFLIIGAALAVVFAGGTFSAFTDQESISGEATAAIVDFELSGDGANTGLSDPGSETLSITFDDADDACAGDYFAPGDSCQIDVTLTRDNILQQLAVTLSVTAFAVGSVTDGGAGDLNGTLGVPNGIIGLDCDSASTTPPGDAGAEWTISYVFEDAGGADTTMPAATDDLDQQIDVTVALDIGAIGNASDPGGCQGDDPGTVAITINATQTGTPHSTAD
jgi:predicted ribosomally synthesized peptide with SipW-like signal peptide